MAGRLPSVGCYPRAHLVAAGGAGSPGGVCRSGSRCCSRGGVPLGSWAAPGQRWVVAARRRVDGPDLGGCGGGLGGGRPAVDVLRLLRVGHGELWSRGLGSQRPNMNPVGAVLLTCLVVAWWSRVARWHGGGGPMLLTGLVWSMI